MKAPVALDDKAEVFRELARLLSLPVDDLSIPERMYLPKRANTFDPGGTGHFIEAAAAVRARFDQLSKATDPDLKRAAEKGRFLFLARYLLAEVNEQYGHSATLSVARFRKVLFTPEYLTGLPNDYKKSFEDAKEIVQKYGEQKVEGQEFRARLNYADMDMVDQQIAVWQKYLLPQARKLGGPAVDKTLVEIVPEWGEGRRERETFQYLKGFRIRNISKTDLTGVVIEVLFTNQFGDKAAQYYYLPEFEAGATHDLGPHLRWKLRRAVFSSETKVTYSLGAGEHSDTGRTIKLTSPRPCPDAILSRASHARYDKEYLDKSKELRKALALLSLLN